jgi:cell volume regulation protein A
MCLPLSLLISAIVIIACVLLNRISNKLGVPMLLAFIGLGMLFGSDGLFKIPFENYKFAEQICSVALLFIIFYGGFSTKWSEAKPVAIKSILLSTVGVFLTAGLTGLFCYFALHIDFLESLLIGSIISSTDAASVFSILRSKRLNLKENTASMLEMESGSNDPSSYMLTVLTISLMKSLTNVEVSVNSVLYMAFSQIVFGTLIGVVIAFAALFMLQRLKSLTAGFDAAFVLAVAVLGYAIPTMLKGNGYLSVYIIGIILGNSQIRNKRSLVHFFVGITGLMQMLIFFLLGLLSFPSKLPPVILPSIAIALFLTFVARPAAVFALLTPAKCSLQQQTLVSWAGLRGAASIVFAIIAITSDIYMKNDIFHIVFCIVLLSISFQGTLIPFVAKKLNMIDDNANVLKTFNDYTEEVPVQFIKLAVRGNHPWINKYIKEITIPPGTLLVLVNRDKKTIVPKGDTIIRENDVVILSAPAVEDDMTIMLNELRITHKSKWNKKKISDISPRSNQLIIMIKRKEDCIIPNGSTVIKEDDELVISIPT